jgi:chromosomal replication initiator protein
MVAIKESSEPLMLESQDDGTDEATELLNKARTVLKRRLSFFVWQGFFEPLKALKLANRTLAIEAPTSFHRNWVIDHYMGELNAAISEVSGEDIKIDISFSNDARRKMPPPKAKTKPIKTTPEKAFEASDASSLSLMPEPEAILRPKIEASVLPIAQAHNFNTGSSFEAFVPGPSNHMAYSAALSIADFPENTQFSPLFVFGESGLGKTHLLHAIGIRAKEKDPNLRVTYLSAEQWVNLYIQAIRERQFDLFRDRYRKGCDILLIDDIQFLAGKDASQDEFFHTFNCLHEAKKQIVLTSDKYPHEISGLEERLQTRLAWGLIADIRPPEIETRIAILHKKAEKLSIVLSDEILNYLATNITSSVRELEGALVRLAACSNLGKRELSLANTKEVLGPMLRKKTLEVSWQKVSDVVADYYDLRTSDLVGQARQRQVSFARQVAMMLCRSLLGMSLPEIGRAFGGRDHSTVLSSLRKIDEQKRVDVSLQSALHKIEAKIYQSANA